MVEITAEERKLLEAQFPSLYIRPTKHHIYMAAHGRAQFFLAKIRHEKGVKT